GPETERGVARSGRMSRARARRDSASILTVRAWTPPGWGWRRKGRGAVGSGKGTSPEGPAAHFREEEGGNCKPKVEKPWKALLGGEVHRGKTLTWTLKFHRPSMTLPTTRLRGTLFVAFAKFTVMTGCVCTYHA